MPTESRPPLFGRLVVQLELATDSDVERCLAEVERRTQQGRPCNLGDVMVDEGLLTPHQVQQILRLQKKELLICQQCKARMNVVGYRATTAYHCRICGGILVRPTAFDGGISSVSEVRRGVDPSAVFDFATETTPRAKKKREQIRTRDHKTDIGEDTQVRLNKVASEGSLTGQKVGNYHIKEMLGQGGMASVYLAENIRISKLVALKVLHHELAIDKQFVARFFREARIAAGLDHHNIVSVWDVGEVDGDPYIVMEFVKGESMKSALFRRGVPYSPREAVYWHNQVLDGLEHAHAHGIIHRDLKPDNFLINSKGTLKIADFGIARLDRADPDDDDEHAGQITAAGQIVGTPRFMAPEVLLSSLFSVASDLYSVGISLYLTSSGHFPFEGTDLPALVKSITTADAKPLSDHLPDARTFCATVMRSLSREPGDRFESAEQLRTNLAE